MTKLIVTLALLTFGIYLIRLFVIRFKSKYKSIRHVQHLLGIKRHLVSVDDLVRENNTLKADIRSYKSHFCDLEEQVTIETQVALERKHDIKWRRGCVSIINVVSEGISRANGGVEASLRDCIENSGVNVDCKDILLKNLMIIVDFYNKKNIEVFNRARKDILSGKYSNSSEIKKNKKSIDNARINLTGRFSARDVN